MEVKISRAFVILIFFLALSETAFAEDIRLISTTLKGGMLRRIPGSQTPQETQAYKGVKPLAIKSNFDLDAALDEKKASRYHNGKMFFLFYNYVQAPSCPRDYVIQRVKLTKSSYDISGKKTSEETTYLVEVMKLDKEKFIKRGDEHKKSYSIGSSHTRELKAVCEVGCGEIPGLIEGNAWPFERNILYKNIQDYSKSPRLYNDIRFDSSAKYDFGFKISKDGSHSVDWPEFVG